MEEDGFLAGHRLALDAQTLPEAAASPGAREGWLFGGEDTKEHVCLHCSASS